MMKMTFAATGAWLIALTLSASAPVSAQALGQACGTPLRTMLAADGSQVLMCRQVNGSYVWSAQTSAAGDGYLKVRPDGTGCIGSNVDAVRFANGKLQYCNGSSWADITIGGAGSGGGSAGTITQVILKSTTWKHPRPGSPITVSVTAVGGGAGGAVAATSLSSDCYSYWNYITYGAGGGGSGDVRYWTGDVTGDVAITIGEGGRGGKMSWATGYCPTGWIRYQSTATDSIPLPGTPTSFGSYVTANGGMNGTYGFNITGVGGSGGFGGGGGMLITGDGGAMCGQVGANGGNSTSFSSSGSAGALAVRSDGVSQNSICYNSYPAPLSYPTGGHGAGICSATTSGPGCNNAGGYGGYVSNGSRYTASGRGGSTLVFLPQLGGAGSGGDSVVDTDAKDGKNGAMIIIYTPP